MITSQRTEAGYNFRVELTPYHTAEIVYEVGGRCVMAGLPCRRIPSSRPGSLTFSGADGGAIEFTSPIR